MKKALVLVMAVLFVLVCLAGCATDAGTVVNVSASSGDSAAAQTESAGGGSSDTDYTFCMIYQDLSTQFNIYFQEVLSARCAEAGINLLEFDGQADTETQLRLCENAISQGVDVIMFIPIDKSGCVPMIEDANTAGIPIICCNNITDNWEDATAYVGANDKDAGIMETEYIVELLGGKGNIAIVEGPFGHSAQVARQEGINEVLANYPDIHIVFDDSANWYRDEAMQLAENWLQTGTQIDAFICHNDDMAMGVYQALEGVEKTDIPVIGIDAIYDALVSVKEGGLCADVFQDVYGQAEGAFDVAMKIMNGESFEHTTYIPFQLVTQDNVDEYLKNFE